MEIIQVKIEDLVVYSMNAKEHPQEQIEKIKNSIKEFGFNVPLIIDNKNVIIAGHGRYKAAIELEMKEVPCIRKTDLTENQIKAFRIADNKVAESDWIDELLKDELVDLKLNDYDLSLTGFDEDELTTFFIEDTEVKEDDFVEVQAYERAKSKCKIQEGDIYQLGEHRLMCGDSTKTEDVNKLMKGNHAKVLFTDPPYNISYKDMKGKHEEIKNDNQSEGDFIEFIKKIILNYTMNTHKDDKRPMYLCCNWKTYHLFHRAMDNIGHPIKSCIVWDKERGVQNLDKYHKQHEFILYNGPFGGQKTLRGDIYRLNRETSDLHPTMKPIKLCADFIIDSSKEKQIVLDLFGGSGSTLIACEQLNRKCYMMELDPIYCQVIIDRWEKFTGKESNKIQ